MKNNIKKATSLILCALILAGGVSCSESTSDTETESQTVTAGASAESETTIEYPDDLGDDLDFGGLGIRILVAGSGGETGDFYTNVNEDDMADPVVEAVWKRNNLLEERIGVVIAEPNEVHRDSFVETVRNSVTSDSDDYDLLAIHARLNVQLSADGMVKNLDNVKYLDFTKDYWNSSYIENLSYKNIHYWAGGDITTKYYSHARALAVNMMMWNQYYPGDDLYDTVMSGKWVKDDFNSRISGVYTDLNGNGQKDVEDIYGMISDTGLTTTNMLMFGAGAAFTKYEEDGIPMLDINSEHNIDVFNFYHSILTENENVFFEDDKNDIYESLFANRQALFLNSSLGLIEEEVIRNMEDDFYLIPAPKYDETQENYRVTQQDGFTLMGMPITVNTDNLDAIGASLEGMASMASMFITPAYYETSLKDKYSRNVETQNLIDLIESSIVADFCYAWGDVIGYMGNTTMTIFSGNIQKDSIVSVVEKNTKIWNTGLQMLFDSFEEYIEN